MKPLLICLCGPSSAGKDVLLNKLECSIHYTETGDNFHRLISDTTRPKRVGEIEGFTYNYISQDEFENRIAANQYLEYTYFREWYYGTPNVDIEDGHIYMGIFNPEGIINMFNDYKDKYNILIYYITCPWFIRLYRSVKREHRVRLEHFRRLYVDWRDFRKFRKSNIPYMRMNRHLEKDLELKILQIYLDLSAIRSTQKNN